MVRDMALQAQAFDEWTGPFGVSVRFKILAWLS